MDKLKAFADDKLHYNFDWLENIVRMGENAAYIMTSSYAKIP